ncbi:cation/proton antiporter [Bacteroidales bacterium]|nr:cation/proton antiporter [Bacteroidales bacterium]
MIESVLLILSILFFISIWIGKIASRFGVPALLLFLGVGMFFGSDGVGIVFDNLKYAEAIGTIALCIILFSGGLNTKFSEVRPILKQGIVLSTLGVLITAGIVGIFTWWLTASLFPSLGLSLMTALLLSCIISSTDSASVFAILGTSDLNLKNNLRPTLELESGSNDPMAYVLTITLIQLIKEGTELDLSSIAFSIATQLLIGCLAGYILGKLAIAAINKVDIENEAFYPILVFVFCIFIFSFTYFIKGNGFLSIYVAGLIIGNKKFVHKRFTIKFFDGIAWLSQILMFLTLGLLVNPRELLDVALPGLIIGLFMIFFARPISVFLCLAPFSKITVKDKLFLSWVGLRGAVPIIFAIYPLTANIPHARFIFNIIFFMTLLSLLLQGTLLSKIARYLNLIEEVEDPKQSQHFDSVFTEDAGSVSAEITINHSALLHGSKLMDMPLPENCVVVMVKRNETLFIPRGKSELHVDDKLLIITDNEQELRDACNLMSIDGFLIQS